MNVFKQTQLHAIWNPTRSMEGRVCMHNMQHVAQWMPYIHKQREDNDDNLVSIIVCSGNSVRTIMTIVLIQNLSFSLF